MIFFVVIDFMDWHRTGQASLIIEDVAAMERWSEEIGKTMTSPGLLALIGPMGAGKTHFAKGFARGLGYAGEVSSPTFALVHEYRGGRWPIFHFDFHRLSSASEVLMIGWDDYLDQQGILLVEWADLFPELWPEKSRSIFIEISDNSRKVLY
jgi:tRNA threonylcarbamoyladenosine biosynthesis protein TsaE